MSMVRFQLFGNSHYLAAYFRRFSLAVPELSIATESRSNDFLPDSSRNLHRNDTNIYFVDDLAKSISDYLEYPSVQRAKKTSYQRIITIVNSISVSTGHPPFCPPRFSSSINIFLMDHGEGSSSLRRELIFFTL